MLAAINCSATAPTTSLATTRSAAADRAYLLKAQKQPKKSPQPLTHTKELVWGNAPHTVSNSSRLLYKDFQQIPA